MKLFKILLLFIALITISCAEKKNPSFTKDDLVLIPQPKSLKLNNGSFEVTENTKIVIPQDSLASVSSILNDLFKKAAGFELETSIDAASENSIQLKINSEIAKEAYELKVTSENVILEANSKLGFVYINKDEGGEAPGVAGRGGTPRYRIPQSGRVGCELR